jgi:hypothetical protein
VAELLVKVKNQTTRELYAQQLAGVLRLTSQQVSRALREAAANLNRRSAVPGNAEAAPTSAPAAPLRELPAEELHVTVLLASYPELVRSPEATRAGDLLIDPALRQLLRALTEQLSSTGRLDTPAWLDTAAADVRRTVAEALMNDSIVLVPDPAAQLRKLVMKLEILRLDAEISMNDRMLVAARERGDDDAARSMIRRGMELTKTKLGLKGALERP